MEIRAARRHIRNTGSFDNGIAALLREACRRFQWSFGAHWALGGDGNRLALSHVWADEQLEASEFMSDTRDRQMESGLGMVGATWSFARVHVSRDPVADMLQPRGRLALQAGLSSGVWVPLAGPRGAAVLEFLYTSPELPTLWQVDVLQRGARMAATLPTST